MASLAMLLLLHQSFGFIHPESSSLSVLKRKELSYSNALPGTLIRRHQSTPLLFQSFNNNNVNNNRNRDNDNLRGNYGMEDNEEYRRIPLDLEVERQLQLRREPPIATLTWFDLPEDATAEQGIQFVTKRARDIVRANPWLESGKLEGLPGDVELVFEAELYEPTIEIVSVKDAQLLIQYGSDRPIAQGQEYQVILKYRSIDETQGPLWRISIVPAYGQFGLIFSVSHQVVDIHAYYKLYDMLTCRDQKIGSLDMKEPYMETNEGDMAYSDEQAIFFVGGPRIWKLIYSPWLVIKGIYGVLEQKIWRRIANGLFKTYNVYDDDDKNIMERVRTKVETKGVDYWFEVDAADLQLVKDTLILEEIKGDDGSYLPQWVELDQFDRSQEGGLQTLDRLNAQYRSPPALVPYRPSIPSSIQFSSQRPYISTNDVLSAWFFQTTKCRMGLICCNYRGKLKGHHKYLGRNYWGTFALTPDQFDDPFGVREHIQRPSASEFEFPKVAAELLEPKPLGVVSSWTIPSEAVPYFEPKEHWPLYDVATNCPANFVVLRTWWIQRPTRRWPTGRIGVYVAGDANWLVEPLEFNDKIPSFLFELL